MFLRRLKRLSLAQQIAILLLPTIGLACVVMVLFVSWSMQRALLQRTQEDLGKEVRLVALSYDFYDQTLRLNVERLGDIFFGFYPDRFRLDESETVRVGRYDAPILRHGGEAVNLDASAVDLFADMTGGVATVFARYGDDFLRVTTSLQKEDGSRALGTLLGKSHPGYQTLLSGRPYFGQARLFGRDYMTQYIPVKDDQDRVVGILFVGFDFTEGRRKLEEAVAGLRFARTGFAYLVDREGEDRGTLLLHPTLAGRKIQDLVRQARAPRLEQLLEGEGGHFEYRLKGEGFQHGKRLLAYADLPAWGMTVAAEGPVGEFAAASRRLALEMALLVMGSGLLVILAAVFILRTRLRPVGGLKRQVERLGQGDLTVEAELGDVEVEEALGSRNELTALSAGLNRTVHRVDELLHEVVGTSERVASTVEGLRQSAMRMQESAESTLQQATAASAASEQINANISNVATGAEEMNVSLAEVARKAAEAAGASQHAVKVVQDTSATVQRLGSSSAEIAKVTRLITTIAEQTNLLALNATIEAARAGEAGKGFAVVASEVKDLAQATAKATEEIQGSVDAIGQDVSETAQAMERIREAIAGVDEFQATVATAMEEQSATIGEISRSIGEVAQGSGQIAETIQVVAEVAGGTRSQAEHTLAESDGLGRAAADLKERVGRFTLRRTEREALPVPSPRIDAPPRVGESEAEEPVLVG